MALKYYDKENVAALDNVANGAPALPYINPIYSLGQAAASDTIYGAPTTLPYDFGAGTPMTIGKAITFDLWDGVRAGTLEWNGGDATRLVNLSGVAGAVLIANKKLENTRVGLGSYIAQAGAATRNFRLRSCVLEGSVGLGAVTVASGASGVVIEDTCTINMTAGAAVYAGLTASWQCYADVTLNGAAQGAFFLPAGDADGAGIIIGGTIILANAVNNYCVRCASTNRDADITIHGSFHLSSVPSVYNRAAFNIQDPRSFTVLSGARIDTRGTTIKSDAEVWVRSNQGITGAIFINGLTVDRGSYEGYTLKIGDESPFSASHTKNSYTDVEILGCLLRDGNYHGTVGVTQTHVIFIGNEINYKVANNRLIEGAYGLGVKGDDTSAAASYFYNNYVQGMRLSNQKTKGMSGVRYINNHVVEGGKGGIGADLTENTDDGASGTGDAAKVLNNIMEMDTEKAINIDTASDLGNNEIDYNVYILTGTSSLATASGVNFTASQIAEWQERGHDLHSYVVTDRDQIFDSNGDVRTGSVAYQTGKPISDLTEIADVNGANAPDLVGVTLSGDTNYKRRVKTSF